MRVGRIPVGLIAVGLLLAGPAARAGEKGETGGEKAKAPAGLAANYPGDAGLAGNPAVIFLEDFERGDIAAIGRRWGDASNPNKMPLVLSGEGPPGSPGSRSLRVTATRNTNSGGYLYHRFPEGVDQAFVRFYVRFAPDGGYIHHFVAFGGYNPPRDQPRGGVGERPRGDDRVSVALDPWGQRGQRPPPGIWQLYTYWHQMKARPNGRYMGNRFVPEPPVQIPRDQWLCVEAMVRLNSAPDRDDGELALWLDGEEQGRWSDFNWRTSQDLKLNFLWLVLYSTEIIAIENRAPEPPRQTTVFFDHIVVAREYIGPMTPAPEDEPEEVDDIFADEEVPDEDEPIFDDVDEDQE